MIEPAPVTSSTRNGVRTITLDRIAVRNAFNPEMISALRTAFDQASADASIRAVLLRGLGPAFCSGADLAWMRDSLEYDETANLRDAGSLVSMMHAIDRCPIPVVARVHGAAIGGGVGLLAASDVVVAAQDTRFAFSEARLGLAPAVIAPFVIRRLGAGNARALFLTAERFDAAYALRIGLVHHVVAQEALDVTVNSILEQICANGPEAVRACKQLVRTIEANQSTQREVEGYTSHLIAQLRVSDEGQEGIKAFLEKRPPRWL